MSLQKVVSLDQIEITRVGAIQLRMAKQIVEDGEILGSEYHRTVIDVGGDVDAQIAAVNRHLAQMGWPAVSDVDLQKAKAHALTAWTPEVIAATKSTLDAGIAAKRADVVALIEQANTIIAAGEAN